jgi:oxygen-independent coproporphyrinogen-3 oxidase
MKLLQIERPSASLPAELFASSDSAGYRQQRYSNELVFYVHIPFCTSKCHFCMWVSRVPAGELVHNSHQYEAYVQSVIKEIEGHAARGLYRGRKVRSIYFGGGTPSVLSGDQLVRILKTIEANVEKSAEFEAITVEVSPQTLDLEKMCQLREAGFNRISMGVQLFSDRLLKSQARGHTVAQAIDSYYLLRQAGFNNINLDFMLGLPDTTTQEWEETIQTALQLYSEHLSLYIFVPAASTVSGKQIQKGITSLGDDETLVEQHLWAAQQLTSHGYLQYTQQLFEREGKRAFTDESCFRMTEELIGHGAGAYSTINGIFFGHSNNLNRYMSKPTQFDYSFHLATSAATLRSQLSLMMFTPPGIDYEIFKHRIGQDFATVRRNLPEIDAYATQLENSYGVISDEHGMRYPNFEIATRAAVVQRLRKGKNL